MTDTRQPAAAPAEANADYQRTIRVQAPPDAVFDAITSLAGLAGWWVPRVTGSGAELRRSRAGRVEGRRFPGAPAD